MHVIVIWSHRAKLAAERRAVDAAIEAILEPYASVRALPTAHIVPVAAPADRVPLRARLLDLAHERPADFHLLISPIIASGTYSGWLPRSMWERVNAATEPGAQGD